MKVNFDGLRKNGAHAYNRLTKVLNRYTIEDEIGRGPQGDNLTVGDIWDEMSDLRAFIGTLLALEGDETGVKSLEIDLLEFAPESDA